MPLGPGYEFGNTGVLDPMKNLIILAVIVAIGAGVWFFTQRNTAPEVAETPADEVTEPAVDAAEAAETVVEEVVEETTSVAESAEEAVTEAVEEGASDAAVATEDAASDAVETATEATEAVEETATDAVEAVEDTAGEATGAVENTATDAAESVEETATEATETATDAAEATADAAGDAAANITELLTVDGFEFDQVIEYVDNSELSTLVKTTTKAALEQARDNPEVLQGVLETLRGQLGLE